jgi:hypothetical protein
MPLQQIGIAHVPPDVRGFGTSPARPERFETAQTMFDRTKQKARRTPSKGRRYLLTGMSRCGIRGRRMQGQRNHGRPYYRCEYPVDEEHLEHTCDVLAGSGEPDSDAEACQAALREPIRSCDQRIERYRALLDEGGAIATIASGSPKSNESAKPPRPSSGEWCPAASSRSRRAEHWWKRCATLSTC